MHENKAYTDALKQTVKITIKQEGHKKDVFGVYTIHSFLIKWAVK